MYNASLHPVIILFALLKMFVKISTFAILFLIIQRTAGNETPILLSLPPVLRAVLIAVISWTLILPLYFDISKFLKTYIDISNRQIYLRQGLFLKHKSIWSIDDIINVSVYQSSIGKMLNFGDVTFIANRKKITIKHVKNPNALKRHILQES